MEKRIMENKTIYGGLDPEITSRMTSDPEAVGKAKQVGVALGSAAVALGVLSSEAFGKTLPQNIVDVLNFAFTLENLESEFYATALRSSNLIPAETQAVFKLIGDHEIAHVALLGKVLGKQAAPKPAFDYTAGGAFADVFSNYQTFLAVSQAFEDTGVRAYKGQAGNLITNGKLLTVALQIHSVAAAKINLFTVGRDKPFVAASVFSFMRDAEAGESQKRDGCPACTNKKCSPAGMRQVLIVGIYFTHARFIFVRHLMPPFKRQKLFRASGDNALKLL